MEQEYGCGDTEDTTVQSTGSLKIFDDEVDSSNSDNEVKLSSSSSPDPINKDSVDPPTLIEDDAEPLPKIISGKEEEELDEPGLYMTRCILKIINQVFETGNIPEQWKESHLVSIPKKGDLTDRGNHRYNHRGISLMNTALKIITLGLGI